MSDKKRKLKDKATRFVAKGKYKDALGEYRKLLKLDPRDLGIRQKIAETHARLGQRGDAVREYQGVAGRYAADGLLLKAIAISKVILTIDPHHTETQEALAQLYAKKRGDFSKVQMPKAMSAAMGPAKVIASADNKSSASAIRGTPARSIGSKKNVAAPTAKAASTTEPDDGDEIDLDDDFGLEVIDVEDAALGAKVETNLNDLMAMVGGGAAPSAPAPEVLDIDLTLEPFDDGAAVPAVVGTLVAEEAANGAVPTLDDDDLEAMSDLDDDDLLIDDDDDAEMIDIVEPVEIETDALPPMPLFSELPGEAFVTLTERMGLHQAEAGEIVIAEGEYASSMYVVIQGLVRVVRQLDNGQEVVLAELRDGAFFGEMALLSDAPRTATVIAAEDTMLFEISRELLTEITVRYPHVGSVAQRFYRNRQLTNLLKTSPLFAPFSVKDKKALIEQFKSRNVTAGKALMTAEQPGDGLYVLLSGRCDVLVPSADGREVVLAELRDGDIFGEMSALFKRNATATVRTTTPCVVLRLPRNRFDELIMSYPQVLETLSQLSEMRAQFNQEILPASEHALV